MADKALDKTALDVAGEQARTKVLVSGLYRPNPAVYWLDLIGTSVLGWGAFASAVVLEAFSVGMFAASAVAVLALYRGMCFIHEISHVNPRALPGFERAWNVLLGYPMLMPSFVYVGVHQAHHGLSTYGTDQDPEYLPFSRASRMTVFFALQAFLFPIILIVRFLILTPIAFLNQKFTRWMVTHASSLAMNAKYRRPTDPKVIRMVASQSAYVFLFWALMISAAAAGLIPWRWFAIWLPVTAIASFINTLRTLGSHTYESEGSPLDRMGQLKDSIDTPGAFYTELWAPVGLRYHALHHYFPGIPYHNLPEAYRRLLSGLPDTAVYREASSPSLWHSLRTLYQRGASR